MIISAFSDGEKKDKIAEFYDTENPTVFLRGALEIAKENEHDFQMTFVCRQEIGNVSDTIKTSEFE